MKQRPYDDEEDLPTRRQTSADRSSGADREVSLGTPAILGIFFALALICACFFGFGYTMGRKAAQANAATDAAANADTSGANANSAKPAAGSLANQPAPANSSADQSNSNDSNAPDSTQSGASPSATQPDAPSPAAGKSKASPSDAIIVGDKPIKPAAHTPPPAPAPSSKQPAAPPAKPAALTSKQPAAAPAGSFMVQVAAVSSQEVADIEISALKKKGYNVAIHHEPQDKLLHVQIGPFANRKDAQTMQQRVLADGFNAIVK